MKPADTDPCPYCRHPFGDRGGPTRDHIFGKAFGGRGTVWVCKGCNDTIGSNVEGVAHRAQQVMALIKQRSGLGGGVLGTVDLGAGAQPMNIDLTTGEITPVHPRVKRRKDGDQEHITVAGSPEQVRQILEGLLPHMPPEEREGLIQDGLVRVAEQVGAIDVKMSLEHPLGTMQRLAAKVALGAGTRIWGEQFAAAPLADGLREMLHSPDGKYAQDTDRIDPQALHAMDEVVASLLPPGAELVSLQGDCDGRRTSQVAFVPLGRAGGSDVPRAGVLVSILGITVTLRGMVVEGTQPSSLPVVYRERLGEDPEIIDVEHAVVRAISHHGE